MSVSMKDLRYRTKEVLESLKRGEKPILTHRGHPVAKIVPLRKKEKRAFHPIGFGMWKDHRNLEDVSQWLDDQRKPRHER